MSNETGTDAGSDTEPTRDAYELLSAPTLSITDAELRLLIADLRQRRLNYVAGKPDRRKAAPRAKPTAAAKADNTANLLADLGL